MGRVAFYYCAVVIMVKTVEEKIRDIATKMQQKGTKTIFYIGAGCSASAGVPTFHGTGAAGSLLHVREDESDLIMPSFAHRAIRVLIERGYASHATTSNHDGLVHKTGLDPNFITEMFGSSYVELCLSCGEKLRRLTATPSLNRKCELCGGKLKKKGCRYGQAIESDKLERGTIEAKNSDISICLGSGMHTWPFTLDGLCGKAPLRVVVNIGRTSADGFPGVEKYDMACDEFMRVLCSELDVEIPPFVYEQRFNVYWKWDNDEKTTITVGLSPFNVNEAVTWAQDEAEIICGDYSRIMERNSMKWTFQESSFPAKNGDTVTVRLLAKEEFDEPDPVLINLPISSSMDGSTVSATFATKPIL